MSSVSEIVNYYREKVSRTVVSLQITDVIENIKKTRKVSLDFIYYALRYAVENQITIKSPLALYYLVDSKEIKRDWKEMRDGEAAREMNHYLATSLVDPTDNDFIYKPEKFRGFGGILDGH